MKVHFLYGCPWADGSLQQADTLTTCVWDKVTCKSCLKLKATGYGKKKRAKRFDWDAETDTIRKEYQWELDKSMEDKHNVMRK